MKIRKQIYGDSNVIGKNVEKLRKERHIKQKDFIAKLQLAGWDVNPTSYSKLEGQVRAATDTEVYIIAKVLGVKMEELFELPDAPDEVVSVAGLTKDQIFLVENFIKTLRATKMN